MSENRHFALDEQAAPLQLASDPERHKNGRLEELSAHATECARGMTWLPGIKKSSHFSGRLKKVDERLRLVFAAMKSAPSTDRIGDEQRWLYENASLLRSVLAALLESKRTLDRIVHVRRPTGDAAPRALVIAEDLLACLEYRYGDFEFSEYLDAFQSIVVLRYDELWAMAPALKFILLERIAALAIRAVAKDFFEPRLPLEKHEFSIATCIRSLREVEDAPWLELLEPLVVFDRVLRRDPAGAYPKMDPETRESYRRTVVRLASSSDRAEIEIAELAISLARESLKVREDPRLALRRSHVGYYLIAGGRELLYRRANVRLPIRERWQMFLRDHPDEFYLGGIELLTLSMIVAALWWGNFNSLWTALFAAIALLLPCSQSAVEVMNYVTTSLLQPQSLPKLEFKDGIPDECATMVVVPTLLLNENQVRQLAGDLEVRYVGNMSANLHFALLTDLPDSSEQPREDDPLVDLCGQLIGELNEKYAGRGTGTFFMFHRHRVYSPREGVWMGWERKRGKLLDFNRLILGNYDSFPYKAGDLSVLSSIRYVLTVDSDTELPRGTAGRLIGTLAHPLCQAIVDRRRNVVTEGFGILQPRVGISVQSAAESRLASIYSGRTGFDIYTRAVSDIYQDLYGEGTFVGKGIYEIRTVHQVLDHRFPRNAILSHDLIEGAYARAGLVSDVEVIDRYPSHYSAYTRRKHRWVRGDWQIMEWLFSRVPDESGRRVSNPISRISRWKILDNLRRSMVEPATLALFILGWTVLPGRPLYWTLISLAILFVPPWFQFAAGIVRAVSCGNVAAAKGASAALATALTDVWLTLAFLVHDALVSVDAICRSSYRRAISRQRLLEWETAAEAELGKQKRTPVDLYLSGTPAIALAIGTMLFFVRRPALFAALPVLLMWACSKLISLWLDRPPRVRETASGADNVFLRRTALRTWRYFAEFSTEEHGWLIPDNVQQSPENVAARVSPTNLGFLLNARQVACELGYLTVPEFAEQTLRTLGTMKKLRRYRGHLLNWYDTRTLSPLSPLFVSTVDSGNIAASLIALKGGCAALLKKPILSTALMDGYEDYVRLLAEAAPRRRGKFLLRTLSKGPWLARLMALAREANVYEIPQVKAKDQWFAHQLGHRREWIQRIVSAYMPWLLPEFECLCCDAGGGVGNAGSRELPSLAHLPEFIQGVQQRLRNEDAYTTSTEEAREKRERLLSLLDYAYERASDLVRELLLIAKEAEDWIANMDFGFLLDPRRKLLSIGYHVDTRQREQSCYDLLASESRIATFLAIAKGDIPQDTWMRLGRAHVPVQGSRPTLISWTGTMFEYLMPAIWMRSYPNTVLHHSMKGAVYAHKAYASTKRIPWGISESAYYQSEEETRIYGYSAFGVPGLALQGDGSERVVVAPYASVMALAVDPYSALKNLRRMLKSGWFRDYGFCEAADFSATGKFRSRHALIVKSWMAHHQGMILLSIANFLHGDIVQQWFHNDPRVRATEVLLQERLVLQHVRPKWTVRRTVPPTRIPRTGPEEELALAG